MSDFWVSQQRHWCKYCKKFIANNKPSIEIHNGGRQHKDAVERFLRDVYKDGKQRKEDEEKKLKELQRIEKAAMSSMQSQGLPSGSYQGSDLSASSSSSQYSATRYKSSLSPSKPSTTFVPPPPPELKVDESKPPPNPHNLQGREEWAIPSNIATPGQWQTVAPIEGERKNGSLADKGNRANTKKATMTTHDNAPEFQDDDGAEDDEDLRNFKIQEKQLPVDDDDGGDKETSNKNDGGSLFKKRKVGGGGQGGGNKAKRRIRTRE